MAGDGPHLDRAGRDLHVHRRGKGRRKAPGGGDFTLRDLRTVQDWMVEPQLRTVPGVIEVNTIGSFERQFHVLPDPGANGLQPRFSDGMTALAANKP